MDFFKAVVSKLDEVSLTETLNWSFSSGRHIYENTKIRKIPKYVTSTPDQSELFQTPRPGIKVNKHVFHVNLNLELLFSCKQEGEHFNSELFNSEYFILN